MSSLILASHHSEGIREILAESTTPDEILFCRSKEAVCKKWRDLTECTYDGIGEIILNPKQRSSTNLETIRIPNSRRALREV